MSDPPPAAANKAPPLAAAAAWTPAQLARLDTEWRRLRRSFAFHPHVRIVPLAGEPPVEFRIEYRLRTLLLDDAGALQYADACAAHVSLPRQFPYAGPVVRPLDGVFHPNVAGDVIHFAPAWNPATGSLADVVARCGEMLALQLYDPDLVRNPTAMEWVANYPDLVPTDPNAVLAPGAGEDALQRISRLGPDALERYRGELSRVSAEVLDAAPGTERRELREFGGRLSVELDVFTDPDVPESLRELAAQLDAWARSMAASRSVWNDLRAQALHARSAKRLAAQLATASATLDEATRGVEAMVNVDPSDDPMETIGRLPDVATLDPVLIRVRSAGRDVADRLASLRSALDGLSGPPLTPAGESGSLLCERTTAAVTRGAAEASAARQAAFAAIEAAEPVIARTRAEQPALNAIATWAAFTDLVRRGNELTQRLVELGAAGIQAYYLHAPGGRFGPYQFEERVDVGTAVLVARRVGAPAPVEVFDARSVGLLGKAPGGVRFKLPDAEKNVHDAEVRATEHADELRVQLDYLNRTSREHVALLANAGGGGGAGGNLAPAAWPVRFARALAGPGPLHVAAEVHRRAGHRWAVLMADLDELAPFKERLATHHLVERHAAFVPAVLEVRAKAEASHRDASERLAFIAARSTHDAETDAVLVDPRFADEYLTRLGQCERAERDLAKVRRLLALVSAEFQARLADKRLFGRPGTPTLRMLPINPAALGVPAAGMSDVQLHARIAELRRLLGLS